MIELSIYASVLFGIELLYFRLARRLNILDKPNHRSSHQDLTIRGGGILFSFAGIASVFIYDERAWPYAAGLFCIALVSFWDDLKTISGRIRMAVQLFSLCFLLYAIHFSLHPVLFVLLLIAAAGAINIYNFMDGINGITGLYSTTILASLLYINTYQHPFTEPQLILLPLIAVLVFNFFNLRKKAVCFAGDVGSVSIAFICTYLILRLVHHTNDWAYTGLLLIYGLDGISTIIFRIFRREKLSEAHRSHFYQYLANERRWPHVRVAAAYAIAQLVFNVILVFDHPPLVVFLNLGLFLFFAFVGLRIYTQGPEHLFHQKKS
ncbi:MAG: UDP-GlcNAc--UDP-phosphate GlcNAc-1-phosphate transferase [Mucilaginibacter polytrichastri]|nr:UDP-GlcNAc--UDP-phosphate GlcNAc-1-phosphate transferase [Mucilaginibacter polytrichastri]